MTATWSNIKIFKIQNGGRPPCWKYWKRHNSPTNEPIGTKLGWSHPVRIPTCPPWCGCHGDVRCLATVYCILCCCRRLEAERVNQFWWNLVHDSKFGPQWQSRDQILFFNSKWRPAAMLENIGNAITRQPMNRLVRNLDGRTPSLSPHVRHDAVAMATSVA